MITVGDAVDVRAGDVRAFGKVHHVDATSVRGVVTSSPDAPHLVGRTFRVPVPSFVVGQIVVFFVGVP